MMCKNYYLIFILLLSCFILTAQEATSIDNKYREDQFYISVTYNFFDNQPEVVKQNNFSLGVHSGFIRDFPINKRRNTAIGLGLGLSLNGFNNNILIEKNKTSGYNFEIIDRNKIAYSANRFSMHMLELPIEFRWRTSTAKDFRFWRIYSGFKLGYVFHTSSKLKTEMYALKLNQIDAFENLQYGLNISVGYNTWNFYVYYALNHIFKDGTQLQSGQQLEMRAIKAGLIFYIL